MNSTVCFEHRSVVLHVSEKNFTLKSKDVLQGLTPESAQVLTDLGNERWELVSVVGYSSGLGATEALLAFFKRARG